MKMTKRSLEQIKDYSLSAEDLIHLVGDIDFIKYPDLDEETVDTVFKKRKQCVVLFLTLDKNTGHWIAILQHPGNMIEVFDSYGLEPDAHRKEIPESQRIKLDEENPQFGQLLRDPKYKVIYNKTRLQADGVATCGRHVAVRIMHSHMSLPQYINLVKSSGETPDDFVTIVTYNKIGK